MTDAMFGDPISVYTTEQSIEDGVLVHPFPEKFPWFLLTTAVHAAIEQVDDGRDYLQKVVPLMKDAVMLVKANPDQAPLWTDGLKGNVTGQDVWVAVNDKGGLTLMFPSDY